MGCFFFASGCALTHEKPVVEVLPSHAVVEQELADDRLEKLRCAWQRELLSGTQLAKIKWMAERMDEPFSCKDSYLLLELARTERLSSRIELVEWIAAQLAGVKHTKRIALYRGALDDRAEDFASQADLLSYSDLIRVQWVLETLPLASCQTRISQLIAIDAAEEMSEIGGLCFREDQRVVFQEYAPARRESNLQFVESPLMIRDGWFALARWHGHVIAGQEGELCGPGIDDLKLAQEKQAPMIIISIVRKNVFNVDYLSDAGLVIDLGNYPYE